MDDSVLKAMARWPNVPAVYGWLGLDRRGAWRLRGDLLDHPAARAFINRNYVRDERGCWYFQNGPQRVFVRLEYTPWVYRLVPGGILDSHTGAPCGALRRVFMDEEGAVLFETVLGIGLLDDRDLALFCEALCDAKGARPGDETITERLAALAGGTLLLGMELFFSFNGERLPLQPIQRVKVAGQFNFEPDPQTSLEPT